MERISQTSYTTRERNGKSIKSYAPEYDELAKDVVVGLDLIILTFEYVGPKTKVS
jgi:hypothetical protein